MSISEISQAVKMSLMPPLQRLWAGPNSRPAWVHANAVHAADFKRGEYWRGNDKTLLSALLSTTRASKGWAQLLDGAWREFDNNYLRRTDRGAAIGGAFTNKIRNPRGEGGTVGVIGSGGVLPTNWAIVNGSGLAVENLGSGIDAGSPFTDLRFFGTATSSSNVRVAFENSANALASVGQAWGGDFLVKGIAGVQPSVLSSVVEYLGGTVNSTLILGAAVIPDATVKRVSSKGLLVTPTVNNCRPQLHVVVANATAYDFTLRIYAPKLVQLSVIEGPELVTNGTFNSDITGWNAFNGATLTFDAGKLRIQGNINIGFPLARQDISTVVGSIYKFVGDFSPISAGAGYTAISSSTGVSLGVSSEATTSQTVSAYGIATTTTTRFELVGRYTTSNVNWDNASVKRVTPGYMPAFPILPPVGVPGDSTKLADDVRASDMAWFTAAALGSGATQLVVPNFSHVADGLFRYLFEYSDGTLNNRVVAYIGSDDKPVMKIVVGGVTLATVIHPTAVTAGRKPLVFGWSAVGLYITNGVLTEPQAAVALPPVTQYRIGGAVAAVNFLNDVLEEVQACLPLSQVSAESFALAA